MSKFYLIRHGATQANLEHRYCGSTDLPLSSQGRQALQALSYPIPAGCRFLTSGMLRTNQTMELLFGQISYEKNPSFREVDFGAFEMHTYEELKDDPRYLDWIAGDNMRNVPPGGESGEQMQQRILEALPELMRQDTVLVTHGGVIATILDALFPEEGKNRYQWQPRPGYGYLIEEMRYTEIP